MSVGTWVHLAATYDGTTIRIHVNGRARSKKTGMLGHANADFGGVLHIGRNVLADEFAWGGLIDEVRISRVARYSQANFVPAVRVESDSDTIALWHFDEGAGTIAGDATGAHPGTIDGATWAPTACDAR